MNQTPIPEPTAPVRPRAGAPDAASADAVASDQPLAIPMTPPVSVPDMGELAVAATAFSHDAIAEPANEPASPSPVQSAVGAAQDTAGHAVETTRARASSRS